MRSVTSWTTVWASSWCGSARLTVLTIPSSTLICSVAVRMTTQLISPNVTQIQRSLLGKPCIVKREGQVRLRLTLSHPPQSISVGHAYQGKERNTELYFQNNQFKLRSEKYVYLRNALSRSDAQVSDFEKMVVLTSSFSSEPRYMHKRTYDICTS